MHIFTPHLTLLAGALCGSLWGLGSSMRLVLFSFFTLSLVACSLANCTILKIIILHLSSCTLSSCKFSSRIYHLIHCQLASNMWLTLFLFFFFQWWVVRNGLITPGTNLVLWHFHQVKAHLARLTSDEVNLRVLVVHASSCIILRILSF